ncbi:TetR/AcrR family transcriptional regulator [Saccharothrix algeriensis]|uniref:DNA-binding transcriptional regulator YbjK n=1 Tax=Saccharothrix algeriensis TaxID=173560 RepID=A0A8T8I3C7_9PSEU|nr:TetR family transcriptional regulator [Saccharothrix algeriensis]MBM7810856.1 DNA-binding transcriptional regulator YbjK [Saccharothrix algeriensis]QTR04880.1 TetR family transcriptional regulator [Saccharothrix algeriensis]
MTDRVTSIADAAIHVVATRGMRGLTHRAVDAEAGLPQGSTSAYFRTRKALVEGLVQRLAELDRAEAARADLPGPPDPDALAEAIAGVLDLWLTTGRERTLARYACLLEATRHPELRGVLAHGAGARAQARGLLERAGVPDAERRGRALVAFLDGLLFDRLVGAGAVHAPEPGTPESRADLADAVRTALRAALGK